MTTIRKAVISHYIESNDLSNLSVETAHIAAPSKGEVQCEVIYSSFTGADANMIHGWYPLQKAAPITPGYCFVGRVKMNGPGCANTFAPGDMVIAMTTYDSQAELINYPEKFIHPVKEGVDPQSACALMLDWYTAYGMVNRAAKVQSGQRVFIHGISGAVGYAVGTLCKLRGAIVYGTASERNHGLLKEAGFEPFDYKTKDWMGHMRALGGAHAVFDALGFESFDESYSILTQEESSILVGYGTNLATLNGESRRGALKSIAKLLAKNAIVFCKRSTTFFYVARDDKALKGELGDLMTLVRDEKIKVPIKATFDLDDIKEAHRSWGKAPGVGSLLIRVGKE